MKTPYIKDGYLVTGLAHDRWAIRDREPAKVTRYYPAIMISDDEIYFRAILPGWTVRQGVAWRAAKHVREIGEILRKARPFSGRVIRLSPAEILTVEFPRLADARQFLAQHPEPNTLPISVVADRTEISFIEGAA